MLSQCGGLLIENCYYFRSCSHNDGLGKRHIWPIKTPQNSQKPAVVFGSALHGDDTADSDLDLLVEPLPGAALFDLGGLQDELQELLGVSVDVLTLKDLPVKFRDSVFHEAKPV